MTERLVRRGEHAHVRPGLPAPGGSTGVLRANPDGFGRTLLVEDPNPQWLAATPDERAVYLTSMRSDTPSTYPVPIQGGPS